MPAATVTAVTAPLPLAPLKVVGPVAVRVQFAGTADWPLSLTTDLTSVSTALGVCA